MKHTSYFLFLILAYLLSSTPCIFAQSSAFDKDLSIDGAICPKIYSKATQGGEQNIALPSGNTLYENASKGDFWESLYLIDNKTQSKTDISKVVRGMRTTAYITVAEIDFNHNQRPYLIVQLCEPKSTGLTERVLFIYQPKSDGSYEIPEIKDAAGKNSDISTYGLRGDGHWYIEGNKLFWEHKSDYSKKIKKGLPDRYAFYSKKGQLLREELKVK